MHMVILLVISAAMYYICSYVVCVHHDFQLAVWHAAVTIAQI